MPEQVFTPASPVQEDMFAARRHENLEERVESALRQRGRQVVLFGDTGVGKTSLVFHLQRKAGFQMVRVECGPTFEAMLDDALAQIGARSREVESSSGKGSRGSVSGKILGWGGEGELSGSTETTSQPIRRTPATEAIERLELAGVHVLFLDNYENAYDTPHEISFSRQVSQLLKSLADRSQDGAHHLKVVVAGIPMASEELIDIDPATARRTAQIEVERMPREELDQILLRGEAKIGISFGGVARQAILNFSDGFPYYTHLLALHCARRALRDDLSEVTLEDFDAALGEALADCALDLQTSYNRAVETTGVVRVRRSILEALASFHDTEVPFASIKAAFLKAHPEYKPESLNFLNTATRAMKEDYAILADRGLPKSKRNLYRFKNPLMRGYVRLRMRREGKHQSALWDPSGSPAT
jgi:hypothetical protein